MDRWNVPTDRALKLIGRKSSNAREDFRLSHAQAEDLAARAWGAKRRLFSTNGSSLSNHAVLTATANP